MNQNESNPSSSKSFSDFLLSSFNFSSTPLSCHKSLKSLSPVLLESPTFKLSESNLQLLLQKSFDQAINTESSIEETFNILLENQIIQEKSFICSDCNGPGMYYQKCSHYTCNNCLYLKRSCTACKSPRSFYDFDTGYHLCLKCKSFDTRTSTCKHYCSYCIIDILRNDHSFQCKVCNFPYISNDFKDISYDCDNCNRKGRMMEDNFFKTCSKHLVCYNCVEISCKYSSCLKCQTFLPAKEIYKIKKKLKTYCESCLILKSLKDFQVKSCCLKKFCENCLLKQRCC